jgi:hypothetical protein
LGDRHARQLAELIATRYPDRTVYVLGDAAYVQFARATLARSMDAL